MKIGIESSGKTKKFKGNSKDKDCLTKKLILKTISVDPLTAKEIFERSGYTGTYKTLTGVIARYQRYGYITREGRIPYHYFLTNLGFQHLENPKLGREAVVRAYKERMMSALIKYAGDFDDETLTELFKGRVVTPTVQNNVTEKVVQNKEPAIKILNPSESIADKTDRNISLEIPTSSDGSDIIADLIEENKRLKEENEDMAKHLAGKSVAKAETTPDALKIRNYDKVLLAYKNAIVGSEFFKHIPYNLYVITAVNVDEISRAIKDTIKVKVEKGSIIVLPDTQAKRFVENRFVRRLTESEFKKLQPKLAFGNKKVFILIKSKELQLVLCDLPTQVVKQEVRIKAPTY
jgi:hypothetical protein